MRASVPLVGMENNARSFAFVRTTLPATPKQGNASVPAVGQAATAPSRVLKASTVKIAKKSVLISFTATKYAIILLVKTHAKLDTLD